MTAYVTEVVGDRTLAANAEAAGTTVAVLTAGGTVTRQLLQPDANEGFKLAVGFIFSFLFYFASIMFGMSIATSVIEEKQSRVVEILASAVPLRQLLAGKVLGNVVLALGQMVLFVGVGIIGVGVHLVCGADRPGRGLGRVVPRLLPGRVRRAGLPLGGSRVAGHPQ
jgi:ABC-2 type transport system permease protein